MSNYDGGAGAAGAGEMRERIEALRRTFDSLQARIQHLEIVCTGNRLEELLDESRAASEQVLLAALTLMKPGGVELGASVSAEDAWRALHPDGLEAGRCLADPAWWQGQFREYLRLQTAGEVTRALSEADAEQAQVMDALREKQDRLQEDVAYLVEAVRGGTVRLGELSSRVDGLTRATASIQPEAARVAENMERVRRIADDLRKAAGVGDA